MAGHLALGEELGAADELVESADTEPRHDGAGFFCDGVEIVDDHFGRALELRAELRIRGGDADRAGVEVAFPDIHAAHGDHGGGAEIELLRAEDGGDDNVLAVLDPAVGAEGDAVAEVIDDEGLLRLGKAELPGRTSVLCGGKWRGSGAAIVAGDEDVVGGGFRDPGGDRADARLSY